MCVLLVECQESSSNEYEPVDEGPKKGVKKGGDLVDLLAIQQSSKVFLFVERKEIAKERKRKRGTTRGKGEKRSNWHKHLSLMGNSFAQ